MRDLEGRLQISRLDGRYNGHGYFKYFVTTVSHPQLAYGYRSWVKLDHITLREWCWQQWGPSCEWDMYRIMQYHELHNTDWCWDADDYKLRILLADDMQATLLSLAFGAA